MTSNDQYPALFVNNLAPTVQAGWFNDVGAAVWGAIGAGRGAAPPVTPADVRANLGLTAGTGSTLIGYLPLGAGAVATTEAKKLQQIISVVDRGADPTGVADSTTAIINATGSGILTWFPNGTYKVTNLVLTGIANFSWIGSGNGGVTLTTTSTGSMVKFGNSCNFGVIEGINFAPTGTLAASSGLELTGTSGNIEVRHCVFSAWTGAGAKATGLVGTQMSGHKFYDNYFLQCTAGAATTGQLDLVYSNDMMIAGNQFGGQSVGPFSTYGVHMLNCGNSGYGPNNYSWQNGIAAYIDTCAYMRIFSNRFEQSQTDGLICTGLTASQIQNNWFNNNGLAIANTYKQLRIIAVAGNCKVEGNNFWDWSLGVNSAKYAMSFEGACTRLSIKNNSADKYGTAAVLFDPSMPATTNSTDGALRFSSGTTIVAGSTVYLGKGANNATLYPVNEYLDQTHTVVQLVAQATLPPGAGQSFTYTVYKDGVATALVATLSGASLTQAVANATTVIEAVSNLSYYTVQLVTSGGAATAAHYVQIIYCNR